MVGSMINVAVMVLLFAYMVLKAQRAETRRLAMVPLGVAAVELLVSGLLTASMHPVLTAILVAMRLVILGCCVAAMRRDAALARSRARRRIRKKRAATLALRELQAHPIVPTASHSARCA